MKFVIFFTIWAAVVACIFACNPDGTNQPECVESDVGKFFRNFQNSKAFWWCKKAGVRAELIYCPDELIFDDSSKVCVSPKDFKYTEPCANAT